MFMYLFNLTVIPSYFFLCENENENWNSQSHPVTNGTYDFNCVTQGLPFTEWHSDATSQPVIIFSSFSLICENIFGLL